MPTPNANIELLLAELPEAGHARRLIDELAKKRPTDFKKLTKDASLLSDILALAAYSPLLATTILQNPSYISWLSRKRRETRILGTDELLESLGRFALTNSELPLSVLLSRFRRRELLRIYLSDIRRLHTISETTEEISNLADAILDYALRQARQELDNRYGQPLEIDDKNRSKPAEFCIVCLGKLGSKELNYSSDIDLLYLYSGEGKTSGQGTRGQITNREYFVKLSERVTKIVSDTGGEGAAYRVDLRLRPHGRAGLVAVSVSEAVNYYLNSAQAWERQAMIRSRGGAGDAKIFKRFFAAVERAVYSKDETVENALRNVKKSKDKINLEHAAGGGYNVKLGAGGIREIEFIAQALQLAHGGRDRWLRAAHTLISLSRLAERSLLSETETARLFAAYDFLRRLEHRLQMENGLQTHVVPIEPERLSLVARRMDFSSVESFNRQLEKHRSRVSRVFKRVFDGINFEDTDESKTERLQKSFISSPQISRRAAPRSAVRTPEDYVDTTSAEISRSGAPYEEVFGHQLIIKTSPYLAEMIANRPSLIASLPTTDADFSIKNYGEILLGAARGNFDYQTQTAHVRREWTKLFLEIAAHEIYGKIEMRESKNRQTALAEAALHAGFFVASQEISRRHKISNFDTERPPQLAILGLGKLGSGGMDYGSDLDLALVFADDALKFAEDDSMTTSMFYNRLAEILVNAVSGFTREGFLYRVDLRLRPDGKNGALALGESAFLNYLHERSAIWEWLAYVKLRGVSGAQSLALKTEEAAREIVHRNARRTDAGELSGETKRIRAQIARQKIKNKKITDIKYGEGGMLDVFFAVRFLQLRDNVPDETANRSTTATLGRLLENNSLNRIQYEALKNGYDFLSRLDHNLRLTVGRSNSLPYANKNILQIISQRMNAQSVEDLMQNLALHRLEIHTAFEAILG